MTYSTRTPPMSYSGGKSKLVSTLMPLINHHFPTEDRLLSPFLGAGAVELQFMHSREAYCHAADVEQPLVNFWNHMVSDAKAVAKRAFHYLPLSEPQWEAWYADMERTPWHTLDDASRYWLLRQGKVVHAWSLWSGLLERFNNPKKHWPAISKLAQFQAPRLTVECTDFGDFLDKHEGLTYCDPPYHSERGEKERVYANRKETNVFSQEDHEGLADLLCQRTGWILSNADTQWVRKRYAAYPMIPVKVRYSSRQMHESMEAMGEELIIIGR